MCWTHEWAWAYRNVYVATERIKRAELKMKFRAKKFKGRRERYVKAMNECRELVKTLRDVQARLLKLIDRYGIKQEGSKKLKKILSPPKKMLTAREWVERN